MDLLQASKERLKISHDQVSFTPSNVLVFPAELIFFPETRSDWDMTEDEGDAETVGPEAAEAQFLSTTLSISFR